jgi:hypothetical protein
MTEQLIFLRCPIAAFAAHGADGSVVLEVAWEWNCWNLIFVTIVSFDPSQISYLPWLLRCYTGSVGLDREHLLPGTFAFRYNCGHGGQHTRYACMQLLFLKLHGED